MYRSVTFFVLGALVALAVGRPNREEWEAAKQQCIEETGIDPESVKGPPPRDGSPPDDKMKCFHACMMKQHGTFKEDGSFDLDKAISKIPEDAPDREQIVAAMTECAEKKGENDCETAGLVFDCMREQKIPFMRGGHHGGHHGGPH